MDESEVEAHPVRHGTWLQNRLARHRGYGMLLVFIVAMFLASGIDGRVGSIATSSLGLVMVLVVRYASPLKMPRIRIAVLVAVAGVAAVTTAFTDPGDPGRALANFAQVFVLGMIVVALMLRVLRRPVVDLQTLYGAIAIYMLIGLAFAWLYVGLNNLDEGQFSIVSREESGFFEFSFVVLTTLGFGNEVPTAPLAGRIVVLEAIFGQIFLATFLARLVSMFGQPATGSSDT